MPLKISLSPAPHILGQTLAAAGAEDESSASTAQPCNTRSDRSPEGPWSCSFRSASVSDFFFSFLTGRKFVSQPSCLREQEWQRQEKKSGFGVMLSRLFILGRMQTLADFRGDLTYTSISSFFPWIWMLHRETLRTQAMADRENVSFQRVKGKDSPFSSALVHSELSLSPNYCLFKLYWETHPVLLKTTLRR